MQNIYSFLYILALKNHLNLKSILCLQCRKLLIIVILKLTEFKIPFILRGKNVILYNFIK